MAESPSRMPLPPILLGVGGALLAISGRSQALSDVVPYPVFYQGLLYAGIGFDFIAFAWLLKIFVPWGSLSIENIDAEEAAQPLCTFEAGYADERDLRELREFLEVEFHDAPPVELMRGWIEANPTVFPVIRERNHETNRTTIVCAAKILPCKKHLKLLLDHERAGGNDIRPEDIVRLGGKAALIYLGCVAARRDCRTLWISKLAKTLKEMAGPQTQIYIRPTTSYGMNYARKFPFVAVQGRGGLGHIYRINGDDAVRVLGELRSTREMPRKNAMKKKPGRQTHLSAMPVTA